MATKKEIELCQDILGLAIQVTAQGKYNAWAEYHGHVNSFEVRITPPYQKGIDYIEDWAGFDKHCYLSGKQELLYGETPEQSAARKVLTLESIKAELAKLIDQEVAK